MRNYYKRLSELELDGLRTDIVCDSGISDFHLHELILKKFPTSGNRATYHINLFTYAFGDNQIPYKDRTYCMFFRGYLNSEPFKFPSWLFFLEIKSLGYNEYQLDYDLFGRQYSYSGLIPNGFIFNYSASESYNLESIELDPKLFPNRYLIDGRLTNGRLYVDGKDVTNDKEIPCLISLLNNISGEYKWIEATYNPSHGDFVFYADYNEDPKRAVLDRKVFYYLAKTDNEDNLLDQDWIVKNGNWYAENVGDLYVNELEYESPMMKIINPKVHMINNNVMPAGLVFSMVIFVNYMLSKIKTMKDAENLKSYIGLAYLDLDKFLSHAPQMSISDIVTNPDENSVDIYFDVTMEFGSGYKFTITFNINVIR